MAGKLFVISGPSGAGKGTLVAELVRRVPSTSVSLSATTRQPRRGEVEGREYNFLSESEFERLAADGGLLEWAEVHGNKYGTPLAAVDKELESGRDVVLEIDIQGAEQVKAGPRDAVTIFILPPSINELRRRLRSRGTEDEPEVERRVNTALDEILLAPTYDHVVVNDDVDRATAELVDIFLTERGEATKHEHDRT